jgi:hypothetical protein
MKSFDGTIEVFLAAAVLLLGGCGGGKPPPQEVSGSVKFQKQPLPRGMIEFLSTALNRPSAGALVLDGRYTVPLVAGLQPGSYRVRITALPTSRAAVEESMSRKEGRESRQPPQTIVQIPEKYNANTVLTAEVEAEGRQTIDFNLD